MGHNAFLCAPTSRKIPNSVMRTIVPEISVPTGIWPTEAISGIFAIWAALSDRAWGVLTSIWSLSESTLVTIKSGSSWPTLYCDVSFVRKSASFTAPMSTNTPKPSLIVFTVPPILEPRITLLTEEVLISASDLELTVTRLPCTLTTTKSATSPGMYSSAGLARKLKGARTSVDRPASKKTPNLLMVSTVPSNLSPSLTSEARGRVDTSQVFFSRLMAMIFKPSIVSPTTYSESGLASWFGLHRASLSAPTLMKTPRVVLMLAMVPDIS
mmetsp:Transcript_172037/g.551461  ORF Transcript_172037/g.551461 Transcript_172037/m.551461 type:complete len:269 (-) Transcript_172037:955-1761(-)